MYRLFAYATLCLSLACSQALADTVHRVRKGETLTEIAHAYNVTVDAIKASNDIRNENRIRVGQELAIPAAEPSFIEYRIRSGDNLSDIAKKYGVSLRQLTSYNNIRNANKISVGQTIRIPTDGSGGSRPGSRHPSLNASVLRTLASTNAKRSQWKHIVIHHSGSRSGSAKAFDNFHRNERGMENGLAYHFVIGNGNGMGDGEIHVGDRWKRQIQGGHLSSYALNQISIGICLVGDFQKAKPSRKQMDQLEALVVYLMNQAGVPDSRVTTHTLIHPKHTLCPGKHFPTQSFRKSISD